MIAAVVVTHDSTPELLGRCLDSVVDEVDLTVVVDNGGAADVGDRERVELLRVVNEGYGAAANTGFELALGRGADALVLLNDDVVGRPGWVSPLVAVLGGDVGAAQPVLLVEGTDPPVVNSRGVRIGPDGAGVDVGDGEPYEPAAGVEQIELFTGGAVAMSRRFLDDTGGFDRRWFLYYEDVDLARRGAEQGWRYLVGGDSVVEHARGASTGERADRTRYLQERNRLWCAFRWADAGTVGRAIWLSVRRLRHRPRGVHARAGLAGLAGAPRELWIRWRGVRRVRRA